MRRCLCVSLLLLTTPLPLLATGNADALWTAARKGDAKAVEALLAHGVDVNAKTPYGVTALWLAAYKGHRDVIQVLIKHKADPNVRDSIWGGTPLGSAVEGGHADIVKLLLHAGAKHADAALLSAASQGRADIVRVILDNSKLSREALDAALALTPAKKPKVVEMLHKAGVKPLAKATTKTEKAALKTLAGTYENTRGERFFVLDQDGILTAISPLNEIWVLKPTSPARYHALGQDGVALSFAPASGKASRFTLTHYGADTVFKRAEQGDTAQATVSKYNDAPVAVTAPGNWPSFRGPHASGVADGQGPPALWDVAKGR